VSDINDMVLYSPRVFKSVGITKGNQLLGTTRAMGITKIG
jgi:hypothetical protein